MTWHPVIKHHELKEGAKTCVTVDGIELLLVRKNGFFAIENLCSHEDAPLSDGCLEKEHVVCPLHGWKFQFRTGACETDSDFDLPCFATRVEEEIVYVFLPD